jgi:hypothetical protein
MEFCCADVSCSRSFFVEFVLPKIGTTRVGSGSTLRWYGPTHTKRRDRRDRWERRENRERFLSIGKQLLDDPNVAAMARAGMAASSKVISNQ